MNTVQYPYALLKGRIVNAYYTLHATPDIITCPDCEEEMLHVQGAERAWHFRHKSGSPCVAEKGGCSKDIKHHREHTVRKAVGNGFEEQIISRMYAPYYKNGKAIEFINDYSSDKQCDRRHKMYISRDIDVLWLCIGTEPAYYKFDTRSERWWYKFNRGGHNTRMYWQSQVMGAIIFWPDLKIYKPEDFNQYLFKQLKQDYKIRSRYEIQ